MALVYAERVPLGIFLRALDYLNVDIRDLRRDGSFNPMEPIS
jgi:hypothetical protein